MQKYEKTLWLQKRGKSWKNQHNEKKHSNSDDTQISRPDLRFASRENSETTQNGAGATPNKNHTNPHRVSEICTNELRVCGPNKLKGGEKQKQLQESATQLRKTNIHDGGHLRVLSGVLCLSSNKLTSFKGSGNCHKAWVYSP